MPRVFIPPLLRPLTGGAEIVTAPGDTVGEVLGQLDRLYPGVRERLCEGEGLKPGLTVAVDGDVATLGLLQKVRPDGEVHFLPAIGGG